MAAGLVTAFATPAMIALMENASVAAIQQHLSAGQTSVGIQVNITHLAATPIGMQRARACASDGGRWAARLLQVQAWDDKEKIGEGTHIRTIVDEVRFKRTA